MSEIIMPDGNDKSEVWHKVLKTALAMPGARVDRDTFLRRTLSPHYPTEVVNQAINSRPATAGISKDQIRKLSISSIQWHRSGVTALSFLNGIPGGWYMAATVPADMAQFFWHIVVVLQKLAYLHGWPSLIQDEGDLDDETLHLFTIFAGVMFGAGSAGKALGDLSEKLATESAKRLPKMALTKWGIYKVAKEVAKWFGVKLTKETFARWISKAIPVISGFISGGITWVTYSKMSYRLQNHLAELRLAQA